MNLNDFLAVDENGFKLATRAAFWRGATPEMWAVPHLEVKNHMLANGWSMEEAERAINARYQLLPANRAKRALTNKKYSSRSDVQLRQRTIRSTEEFKEKKRQREKIRLGRDPQRTREMRNKNSQKHTEKKRRSRSDGDFLILAGEAAKTRAFWRDCTPEQKNVNFSYLRWLMTDMGYSETDIEIIRSARERVRVLERQKELWHKKKKISNTH